MRTLLIDDVRTMEADAIVRSAELAKAILGGPLHFDVVYLDHDLGPGEVGLDVLRWIFRANIRPTSIILITRNPVGLANMKAELMANDYTLAHDGTGAWVDRFKGE